MKQTHARLPELCLTTAKAAVAAGLRPYAEAARNSPVTMKVGQVGVRLSNDLYVALQPSAAMVSFRVSHGLNDVMYGEFPVLKRGDLGAIRVTHWVRGVWEECFGVKVTTLDPWWSDVVPTSLKEKLIDAARRGTKSSAAAALTEASEYLDEDVDHMLSAIVAGDELADHYVWLLWHTAWGPRFAMAMTAVLWVNGVREERLKQAYEATVEVNDRLGSRQPIHRVFRHVMGAYVSFSEFLSDVGLEAPSRSEVLTAT